MGPESGEVRTNNSLVNQIEFDRIWDVIGSGGQGRRV